MRKILIFVLGLICFNVNAQELLKEGGYKTSGATSGQTLKWNGTTWLPGIDLDGPYTGSGTVPNNTNATLTDDFTITGADATGTQSPKFRVVATGTDPGVQVWKVGNDSLQLSFISGEPRLEAIGTSGNDFWIDAVGNDIRLGNNSTGVFTYTTKNVLGGYLALPFVETAGNITVTEAQSEILVTGTSGVITLTFDNTSNLLGSAAKTIKVRNQGSHNVTLSRGSQSWEWIDMVGSATASNQTLAAGETATMLWYDGGVTDYYLLQKMPATFTGGSTNLAVTGTSSPLTLTSDTGTDVTFTAGSGVTLSGSSGNITINATGSGDILNGGNTTGAAITIGTNDNNSLNFETNGTVRETIATNGTVTNEIIAATNNAVNTAFTSSAYNGSVVAGFGMKHVYRLNTDLGSLPFAKEDQVYWTTVNEGGVGYTSESKLKLQYLSTLSDHTKFTWSGSNPVLSFGAGTSTFGNAGITTGANFTLGNSNNDLVLGGSTGYLTANSSAAGSALKLNASGNTGYIEVGGTTASTITTGVKSNMDFTQGFTASSGTGNFNNVLLSGTINQTGTASGEVAGIHVNHNITAGINYRGIYIDADGGTNSKGIYQTGSSLTNNFVGKTFFGATTAPTAMLHLGAGTTTLAPLKLTSGTNLTTPQAGAIEWDGTNLFATQTTGPTRKTVAYTTDVAGQTVITPSQITSDQNDWNPTSLSTATLIRINGDASFRSLTGITAPTTDKTIKILNVGSNSLAFLKDHTSSTAANRFDMLKDEILLPGETMEIYYDLTASRWKLMQHVKTSVGRRVRRWQYVPSATSTSPEYHFTWSAGSGAAAALTAPASTNDVRGANLVLGTGTTTTGAAYLSNKSLSAYVNGAAATESYLGMTIYIPTASDATNTYAVEAGLKTSATIGTSVNGVFFRYTHSENSGNWRIVSTVSGTPSTTNTSVAGVPGTTQTLELFKRPNGTVVFYIDGVAQGSISYSGTIDLQPVVLMTKSAGTTNRTFETSFMEIENYNK